jgi:hypothetical protein
VESGLGTTAKRFLMLRAWFAGVHMKIEHSRDEDTAFAIDDLHLGSYFEVATDLLNGPVITD